MPVMIGTSIHAYTTQILSAFILHMRICVLQTISKSKLYIQLSVFLVSVAEKTLAAHTNAHQVRHVGPPGNRADLSNSLSNTASDCTWSQK